MYRLLDNCRILYPDETVAPGRLVLFHDTISEILPPDGKPEKPLETTIDLGGRLVFPALINAHDHLYDTFWPKFEHPGCKSWQEWEAAFQASELHRDRQTLSITDLYGLGMFRNVLSGVGLIVDHFPHEVNSAYAGRGLVSLLEHYYLAHSVSPDAPPWGQGVAEEARLARGVLPFITHCAEGFTTELREEVESLSRLGALGPNTVLVNGIGLSDTDLSQIATHKAALVFCPSSLQNRFGVVPPLRKALDLGIRIGIGTDGAVRGSVNLLDDLRLMRRWSDELLDGQLKPRDLVRMATRTAAEMFRVEKQFGSIAPGMMANFLVFEDTAGDPFESFLALTPRDISMVIHKGALVYGDEAMRRACMIDFSNFSEVTVEGRPKLLYGRPLNILERIEAKLGTARPFPFLPLAAP
ncbi:MAG TPA: amidohydrolase family protein [Candidatus Ozemobacteraceae bacterium]